MRPRFRPALAACALGVVVSTFTPALTGGLPEAVARTRQGGSTHLTAPIVQPGTDVKSSAHAKLVGTVRFHPVRRHRVVQIQRQLPGGSWRNLVKKRENGSGTVTFTAAAYHGGTPYTYRGVALRWKGLPKVAAKSQGADVWHSVFSDEFTEPSLADDPAWGNRVSKASTRDCSSVGDARASGISGGTLWLKVMQDPGRPDQACPEGDGSPYYLNGQVSTNLGNPQAAFTRGTFAARIKFAKSRGQHGAFWLQPLDRSGTCQPGGAGVNGDEIDVVEFFGKGYAKGGVGSRVWDTCDGIKAGSMSQKATDELPAGDHWWSSYHVFSVQWTKHKYIFRVDGREDVETTRAISGVDEYLILSQLTSDWELRQAQRLEIQPHGTTHVDWVRVYQK